MAKNTVEFTCKQCGSQFDLSMKELKRQIKKGREIDHFFCSRSCASSWRNAHVTVSESTKKKHKVRMLGNDHAKRGEFTWYLKQVRYRDKEHELTEEFLQDLWNIQKGKCAASGITLEKRRNNNDAKHELWTASLDRKDSSRGYTKDNVQFLAYGLNLAKNAFSDGDLFEFLYMIKEAARSA